MSEQDRGAYTPPTDEPLAFDARTPRTRRPVPVTLLASAAVLVVAGGALVVAYRSGVRGANEPPRAVGTPIAEVKSAPVEEAKPVDDPSKLDVYDDKSRAAAATPASPTFAAAPEQPQPRPAARPQVVASALPPAVQAAPVAASAAAPATHAAPPPVQVAAQKPLPAVPTTAAAPTHVAAAAPKPTTLAEATPKAPVKAAAAPAAVKPEAPAAKPVKEAAATDAASGARVQIGAFNSPELANAEYAKAQHTFASYTAGKGKHVEPVEVGGKVLYRTAFTGFTKAQAQAFCGALKAAGKACMVK